jgi:hypothetical protein
MMKMMMMMMMMLNKKIKNRIMKEFGQKQN